MASASCRIASGISRIASPSSRSVPPTDIGAAASAASSSGVSGNSGTRHTDHRIVLIESTAPITKLIRVISGMPFASSKSLFTPHHTRNRGREVRQRLREAGKRALREEAERALRLVQPVADIGAVRLHRHVVGGIEHPEQAGGHPQCAAVGHGEQAQAAQHCADQKIGRAPPERRARAVAHCANQRLDDEAGHRPRQPQQRHRAFICAKVAVDRPHVALLQAEAELQAQKTQIHLQDTGQRQARLG